VQLKSIPLERGPELRWGQRVEGTDNQGNVLATGRISFISPQVNTSDQTIPAKAVFDNSEGQLRDGQFILAKVIWKTRPGVLIPKIAVVPLAGKDFVYVAQTQGQSQQGKPQLVARQKPVKLGQIQGNNVQVIEGLQPGEKIIVSGIQNLSDGVPIIPQS
jgi:RND family efflux transporter MFP subunit